MHLAESAGVQHAAPRSASEAASEVSWWWRFLPMGYPKMAMFNVKKEKPWDFFGIKGYHMVPWFFKTPTLVTSVANLHQLGLFLKLVSSSWDYNNCNCWSSSNRSWWTRWAWRTIDFSSFDLRSSSLTGFSRHCTLRLQDPHHTWGVVHK
jgi:hypothetical protein